MSYIDVNVSCGHWPFARLPQRSLRKLAAHLESHKIEKALVSNLEALFYPDPDPSNRELIQTSKNLGSIVPVPVLNLALPDSLENLKAYREMADIKAVKLYPNFHNYRLSSKRCRELAEYLSAASIPLIINARMVDERHQYFGLKIKGLSLRQLATHALRSPETRFLVTGLYRSEIIELAAECSNACMDMSFADGYNLINDLLESLNSERLLLGSHTPLMVTKANTLKLEAAQISAKLKAQIGSLNAKALFSIS